MEESGAEVKVAAKEGTAELAEQKVAQEPAQQRFDIELDSEQDLPRAIGEKLVMQGFCTVAAGIDDDHFDNIYREAKSLDRSGCFREVPTEIADGLLGPRGTRRVAELSADDVPPGIQACDEVLTQIYQQVAAAVPIFGYYARTRTVGLVCEAADAPKYSDKTPELTEGDVKKWLGTFETARLLMLVFLGPGEGKITLRPIDTPETKPIEMTTTAGMAMIIRSDVLSVRHVVTGRKGYVLTSFLCQDGTVPTCFSKAVLPRPQATAKLDEWSMKKLEELATVDVDDMDEHLSSFDNPIWWRSSYDHTYHAANKIAIRGLSVKYPTTFNPQSMWQLTVPGTDVITEVPTMRWDVNNYYDPEPTCFLGGKVNVRHMGYMEGCELFDGKFFKIAPGEIKSMDPMQRLICDSGYEALYRAGRTKNNLLNSATGVFVAAQMAESTMIDMGSEEGGGCEQRAAGTGISTAIMSNRFSFVMGMQGPSVMIDTDASSSLMCLQLSMASCFPGKVMSTMAVGEGIALNMTPLTWIGRVASKEMNPKGRSFTFDASADGWVKSDGNGTVAMDNYLDRVNDQLVHDESRVALGIVSGCTASHVGQVATLNTPSAAATMKCVTETCRNSGCAVTSIDSVETHGDGQALQDAVESTALRKTLCVGGDQGRHALSIVSGKANWSNSIQAAGFASLVKRMYEQRAGMVSPTIHLSQLNPYIAYEDDQEEDIPGFFPTELVAYPFRTSLTAVSGQGFGGTIGCAVLTGYSSDQPLPKQIDRVQSLTFWPGGGGKLEVSAQPSSNYQIAGSWGRWLSPEVMEAESDTCFEATVTVGVNGTEQFRILLDGDQDRVMHPGMPYAISGENVFGPDDPDAEDAENIEDFFWNIEGSNGVPQPALEEPDEPQPALADADDKKDAKKGDEKDEKKDTKKADEKDEKKDTKKDEKKDTKKADEKDEKKDAKKDAKKELDPKEAALAASAASPIGDKYRVRLQVAGKWRVVTWERLPNYVAKPPLVQLMKDKAIAGSYFITGSFNDWKFQEMPLRDGFYYTEATIGADGDGSFLIARNEDMNQSFHPSFAEKGVVDGPSLYTAVQGTFVLPGEPKDLYRIKFKRNVAADGTEERGITWIKPEDEVKLIAAQKKKKEDDEKAAKKKKEEDEKEAKKKKEEEEKEAKKKEVDEKLAKKKKEDEEKAKKEEEKAEAKAKPKAQAKEEPKSPKKEDKAEAKAKPKPQAKESPRKEEKAEPKAKGSKKK